MFYCFQCDNPKDADDGCEERPDKENELICIDCFNEIEEEE